MAAYRVAALSVCLMLAMTTAETQIRYPETRKTDQADDYFGQKVADPYRWLEDDNSAETAAWVEAQNKVTFDYLAKIPAREPLKARLTTLWNFERYGVPSREGEFYIFARNDGLQNQSVYYRARSLDAAPEVLIDPNTLSADGTVALADTAFTDDGRLMAYALAKSGSDWHEWRVREVATGKDLPDIVRVVEVLRRRLAARTAPASTTAASTRRRPATSCRRQPEPEASTSTRSARRRRRTRSSTSAPITRPGASTRWSPTTAATCSSTRAKGPRTRTAIFVQDLATPGATLQPFLDAFDAYYSVVGNDGPTFYVVTDRDAPRGKLVAIDLAAPQPAAWKTLIAEGPNRDVLDAVTMLGDRFVVTWQIDARHALRVYDLRGALEREIALPTLGSVGFSSHRRDREGFYAFTSFTYPTTIYRYDLAAGTSAPFRTLKLAFTPSDFETTQVFYTSKDGTKIPMFITAARASCATGRRRRSSTATAASTSR